MGLAQSATPTATGQAPPGRGFRSRAGPMPMPATQPDQRRHAKTLPFRYTQAAHPSHQPDTKRKTQRSLSIGQLRGGGAHSSGMVSAIRAVDLAVCMRIVSVHNTNLHWHLGLQNLARPHAIRVTYVQGRSFALPIRVSGHG